MLAWSSKSTLKNDESGCEGGYGGDVKTIDYANADTPRPSVALRLLMILCGWVVLVGIIFGVPSYILLPMAPGPSAMKAWTLATRNVAWAIIYVPPIAYVTAFLLATVAFVYAYRRMPSKVRMTAVLGLVALALFAGHCMTLWLLLGRIRTYAGGGAGSPNCVNQLNRLGMAIVLYAHDHGSALPEDLEELITAEKLPPNILLCSWDESAGAGHREGKLPSSFVYLGKGQREPLDPNLVLIYETPGIHDPVEFNLLFGDGSVQAQRAPEIMAEISAGRNPPFPPQAATRPTSRP